MCTEETQCSHRKPYAFKEVLIARFAHTRIHTHAHMHACTHTHTRTHALNTHMHTHTLSTEVTN